MSDTDLPVVTPKPPPATLIRIVNPLLRRVIRSRIGRFMTPLAVVRFTGRHSGRRHDINVGLHDINGVATVFTDRPWRLNTAGGAPVTVMQAGRRWDARAELIEDPVLVGPALCTAVRQASARNLGLAVAKDAVPTADDFAAVGKSMIQIRPLTDGTTRKQACANDRVARFLRGSSRLSDEGSGPPLPLDLKFWDAR